MYCRSCQKELEPSVKFCPHCGASVYDNAENTITYDYTGSDAVAYEQSISTRTNSLAIAGFVLSIVSLFLSLWGITAIMGILFSAMGLHRINNSNEQGRALAYAGIVIGILSIIWFIAAVVILFGMLF